MVSVNLPKDSVKAVPVWCQSKNRRVIVKNVNTYDIAKSHLQCLKNRTEIIDK